MNSEFRTLRDVLPVLDKPPVRLQKTFLKRRPRVIPDDSLPLRDLGEQVRLLVPVTPFPVDDPGRVAGTAGGVVVHPRRAAHQARDRREAGAKLTRDALLIGGPVLISGHRKQAGDRTHRIRYLLRRKLVAVVRPQDPLENTDILQERLLIPGPRDVNRGLHTPCLLVALIMLCGCGPNREQILAGAAAALQAGEVDAARRACETILSRHPYDAEALAGLIHAASLAHATEEYNRWSRELLRVRPWDLEANLAVSQNLLDHGKRKEAVARLMMALQDADFAYDKQLVLSRLGEIQRLEAQRLLEIKETPHDTPHPPDDPSRGG